MTVSVRAPGVDEKQEPEATPRAAPPPSSGPITAASPSRRSYMVCADFDAYLQCEARAAAAYADRAAWSAMALRNVIGASRFSSDATIRQYAKEIWGLESVRTNLGLLDSGL